MTGSLPFVIIKTGGQASFKWAFSVFFTLDPPVETVWRRLLEPVFNPLLEIVFNSSDVLFCLFW